MGNKLTNKQSRFIDEYMIDFNATQAALRCGYSSKTAASIGAENLMKPLIKEEIKRRQEELSKKSNKTREDIIEHLEDAIDQFISDGRLTPNALKAIEILNKMKGWNEPEKSEVTHKGVTINILRPDNEQ